MIEEQDRDEVSSEQGGRRSILMFAYYFPPCVCWPTASMRAEGLATNLIQEGWDPIVVTRGAGCKCLETGSSNAVADLSLRPGVEVRRVEVHRSFLVRASAASERWRLRGVWGRFGYRLLKPIRKARGLTEVRDDWPRQALATGKALMRQHDVHALWTTSVPYRSIGVGRKLQRRHRTPWVAELRDSITRDRAWPDLIGRIGGHRLRKRWYRALRKASAVFGVSPQEAEIDSKGLGRQVLPLPSGFDLTTWESLRMAGEPQRGRDERFRILYAGAFSGDRLEGGALVFGALRRFLDAEDVELPISFTYIGRHRRRFLSEAATHDCMDLVEDGGVLSPAQAREAMMQADLLLLLIPTTQEGGMPGGKLYEYLAAGPPILAVKGTDPYVMAILRETQAGDGASTPEEITEVIARRYEEWRLGRAAPRPLDGLMRFTWSARAHQLAVHLDSLAPQLPRDSGILEPIEGVM